MEIKRTEVIFEEQACQAIAQYECVTEQRGMPFAFRITSNLIKLRKMREILT
jgi:hypothetical protein